MSGRNQKIGQWGESVAADYLETHDYSIIARNARTPHGEIDIVAEKDGITIFVEVKTRTSRGTVHQRSLSHRANRSTC